MFRRNVEIVSTIIERFDVRLDSLLLVTLILGTSGPIRHCLGAVQTNYNRLRMANRLL